MTWHHIKPFIRNIIKNEIPFYDNCALDCRLFSMNRYRERKKKEELLNWFSSCFIHEAKENSESYYWNRYFACSWSFQIIEEYITMVNRWAWNLQFFLLLLHELFTSVQYHAATWYNFVFFFWKAKNNNVLLHRTWKTLTLSCDSNGENFASTLLPFTIFFLLLFHCSFFLIIYMDVKIHFIAYGLCLSWKYNFFFIPRRGVCLFY